MDALSDIARAVLYEGYILWPYRRSALKNRQRWTFGGVYPPAYSAASGGVDRARVSTQCLVEGTVDTRIDIAVRFLHIVSRQVLRATADGYSAADEIAINGNRILSWDEAVEREIAVSLSLNDLASTTVPIAIESGCLREELCDGHGSLAGAIERRWEELVGAVTVRAERIGDGLQRVTVEIANSSLFDRTDREPAMRRTLASAHAGLRVESGSFVSLLEPPEPRVDVANTCHCEGLWPVLVGDEGSRNAMLAAPIILYDYPRVAPESPGDLFDGGEIDQLLIFNILTMTNEEKEEMRATDVKACAILERCEALSSSTLRGLHGTIRSMRDVTP